MCASSKAHYIEAIFFDIQNIISFTYEYDFSDYTDDLKTQYACERAILNISESVRKLEKQEQLINPDFQLSMISPDIEWHKIKGVGNIMRHDYEDVTASRVWNTICNDLNELERVCKSVLVEM